MDSRRNLRNPVFAIWHPPLSTLSESCALQFVSHLVWSDVVSSPNSNSCGKWNASLVVCCLSVGGPWPTDGDSSLHQQTEEVPVRHSWCLSDFVSVPPASPYKTKYFDSKFFGLHYRITQHFSNIFQMSTGSDHFSIEGHYISKACFLL